MPELCGLCAVNGCCAAGLAGRALELALTLPCDSRFVRPFWAVAGSRAAELDGMGRYLYIVRHTTGLCARACAPVAQLDRAGTF